MGGLGDSWVGNAGAEFIFGEDKAIYGPWGDGDTDPASETNTQRKIATRTDGDQGSTSELRSGVGSRALRGLRV